MSVDKSGIASKSSHYQAGEVEPIDLIISQKLSFLSGNIVKYVCRAPYKGSAMQDFLKAKQYLEWEIVEQEKRDAGSLNTTGH